MNQINIVCQWSDELTPQFINDFMFCFNEVFGANSINMDSFSKKYFHNIYGKSLLTVAYCDEQPAGIDAMWRNDIGENIAYQTIDTCILNKYRGLGLFRMITEKEIEIIGHDAIFYGFPNYKSYPGYIKFGWKQIASFHYTFKFGFNKAIEECNQLISKDYFEWQIKKRNQKYSVIKKNNKFLLVKNTRIPLVLRYIGLIDQQFAELLPTIRCGFLCLFYSSKTSLIQRRQSQKLVIYKKTQQIPYWKLDFFS